jgi:hypothetical protein
MSHTIIPAAGPNPDQDMSQFDSQSTTDDPTQIYVEPRIVGQSIRLSAENWPHDRQPDFSQYSDDSDASMVPCSVEMPLTQVEYLVPETPQSTQVEYLVPETPQSTQSSRKEEREDQIKQVTAFLESRGYTSFTHKTKFGGTTRIMHLAFHIENVVTEDTEDISDP